MAGDAVQLPIGEPPSGRIRDIRLCALALKKNHCGRGRS